jgi:hypothetical protein
MCLGRKMRHRLSYGLGRSKTFSSSAPFLCSLNAELKTGILAADIGGEWKQNCSHLFMGSGKKASNPCF